MRTVGSTGRRSGYNVVFDILSEEERKGFCEAKSLILSLPPFPEQICVENGGDKNSPCGLF